MRGKAVIAGVGHTRFGKLEGRTPLSMIVEAVAMAVGDAGIDKEAIDAVMVKFPTSKPEFMFGQQVAEALGIQPKVGGVWDQGGAANIGLISQAALAIEAGLCEIAVVCFADNPKSGSRHNYSRPHGADAIHGWYGTPAGYAMIARRHMADFGTTREQLGAVAIAARRHGAANPNAQLRRPLDLDTYLASPAIVTPLHRDDCALVSDGGAAVIVMSAERARKLQVRAPVPILGFGQGNTSWSVAQRPVLTTTQAVVSGAKAFEMAGLTPKDIDVAQIYDCFTITVPMTLEDYGFCRKGEGGAFVSGGRIEIGGALPINTSGGLLSETGMPGLQLVIEGVRQMRGEANLQVPHAKTCIVSNQGGVMTTHATLILSQ
ncbi:MULTISPECIES: thiolase C-terminal domain-containing protein [Paraburkholderia]|uniref:Thiolase family protein n=1 Tax=Paraburkholderia podalyriae TaxID=1938811 RepID=A0ABR7PXM2_9BURK|nr:thiolase family protein [Paraburkholderia podalyriae]MBC8751046.1 thiolase family protein [Paraburkholderia podalyriae]